jgi:hypothetical protein
MTDGPELIRTAILRRLRALRRRKAALETAIRCLAGAHAAGAVQDAVVEP